MFFSKNKYASRFFLGSAFVVAISGCNNQSSSDAPLISENVGTSASTNNTNTEKKINIATQISGNGEVIPASLMASPNEKYNFSLATATGYSIDHVTGCNGMLKGSTYIINKVKNDCTISASFLPSTYTISSVKVEQGNIKPAITKVTHGKSHSFMITPNEGYQIRTINGCFGILKGNSFTIKNVVEECKLNVEFERKSYLINTLINEDNNFGVISPASAKVKHGENISFKITPQNGFEVANVSGCNGMLTGNTYTVNNLTEACAITTEFKPIGRLMISFDDAYAESWWERAQPIFDLYNMKAIYYVNADTVIQRDQKHYIDSLFAQGNIIGHHSCSHQFARTYKGDYIKQEIQRCIDFYKDYNLKHFAYPYGWGTESITKELSQIFSTVRLFSVNWNGPSTRAGSAMSIDGLERPSWEIVWKLLDRARAEGLTIHLATHDVILDCQLAQNAWAICQSELKNILEYADNLGLLLGPPKSWLK
ncbi:polysaccharide deacetylase family protein [Pseudoalteromonas sp. MMG012]|uniref:polysaccharide deacetylase family protein n=1 Tax=Pseudoalteromonas sp. MMG012 TaxID=2822686 RepID=UPI001B39F5CC|nr:polysaccharide deacetylase family protein [Pseudoalteromonas sp. MMG012]MBQ4849847.1 polysaccharide deacetylase family protein [Pseudoalteromonas sp. MMG012]